MPNTPLILTVCTANICRSPMAEALLRHALAAQPEPWKNIRVVSAGVAAAKGDHVSENSRVALKKAGIELGNHTSQPLTKELIKKATLIICMTESHRAMIRHMFTPPPDNVHLFREFMPGNVDKEIGDPFGGPLALYEACRDEMVEAIPSLLEFIKKTIPGA
ncbi:low molecular weight protein arginine phosphatase [Opitutaceae bacterium TAV4]|uniref:low molecular weight protein arginine phosphatase n=1 Tax=Geminisphaera colitermitum TaxID=1148786 RepID=UPI0005BBF8C2|nr:low molecular weight protein arginine phosphatase [Geminisphaera colitermitum]RRJ95904.1 low molecular weight protein arginine phosphatase [Opitutaceae bacterium TAV4]RRK00057.1 low molecular weight protein arginine phosphatase [Opitutaceae bacterium TAV3]